MKRTTISLPDELMEKARLRAREGHQDEPDNFSKYIRELVRRDVNSDLQPQLNLNGKQSHE